MTSGANLEVATDCQYDSGRRLPRQIHTFSILQITPDDMLDRKMAIVRTRKVASGRGGRDRQGEDSGDAGFRSLDASECGESIDTLASPVLTERCSLSPIAFG